MVLKGYDFAGLADAMGYGMRYVRGAVAGGQTRPAEFWKRFAEVTGATCGERADILSRPASREVFSGKFTYWGYVIVLRGEGKEYTFRNPREIYETCGEGGLGLPALYKKSLDAYSHMPGMVPDRGARMELTVEKIGEGTE